MSWNSEDQSKDILVLYEMDPVVETQIERLQSTMRRLGWTVDYCSKFKEDIARVGWIPFMLRAITLAENILVIRTQSGFAREGDRGIDEEIALVRMLKKPFIKVLGDGWQDLDDSEFEDLCKEFIQDFDKLWSQRQ